MTRKYQSIECLSSQNWLVAGHKQWESLRWQVASTHWNEYIQSGGQAITAYTIVEEMTKRHKSGSSLSMQCLKMWREFWKELIQKWGNQFWKWQCRETAKESNIMAAIPSQSMGLHVAHERIMFVKLKALKFCSSASFPSFPACYTLSACRLTAWQLEKKQLSPIQANILTDWEGFASVA